MSNEIFSHLSSRKPPSLPPLPHVVVVVVVVVVPAVCLFVST